MVKRTETIQQSSVSTPQTQATRNLIARPHDAQIAITEALVPLRYKEAVRIGMLGDTGSGKSRLCRAIAARFLASVAQGVVFVVDQNEIKARSWGGQVRKWPADLNDKRFKLAPTPRMVVFTGDGVGDERPLVAACELAWTYSGRGFPTLVILDEVANAVHEQAPGVWRSKECRSIARLFKEGRGQGVSVCWATQFPQETPLALLNETEDIFAFRLAGSALNNLRTKGFTDGRGGRVESTLNALPDTKTPPPQRGAHLRLQRGHAWDGRVYRVMG